MANLESFNRIARAVREQYLANVTPPQVGRQERIKHTVFEPDANDAAVAPANIDNDRLNAVGNRAIFQHDIFDVAIPRTVNPSRGKTEAGQRRLMNARIRNAHIPDRSRADAEADAVAAAPDIAVADLDVLAEIGGRMLPARGANRKTVIPRVQNALLDLHIARTVDGETVRVRNRDIGIDLHTANVHAVTAADVARPSRRVVKGYVRKADLPTADEGDHDAWTEPLTVGRVEFEAVLVPRPAAVFIAVTEERGAVTVNCSLARDGDILGIACPKG